MSVYASLDALRGFEEPRFSLPEISNSLFVLVWGDVSWHACVKIYPNSLNNMTGYFYTRTDHPANRNNKGDEVGAGVKFMA